jgi:hypothetical protein
MGQRKVEGDDRAGGGADDEGSRYRKRVDQGEEVLRRGAGPGAFAAPMAAAIV